MLPIIHKKIRKDKANKGKYPVVLQVYYNKKRKQIFTGLVIESEFWDENKQEANSKYFDWLHFNRILKLRYQEAESNYYKQAANETEIDLNIKTKQSRLNYFDYANKYYDGLLNKASPKYINKCKVAIRDFRAFAGERTFQGVTAQLLKEFEDHLFRIGRKRNTINFVFKKLKQPFTNAVKEQVTDQNPFNLFHAVTYKQTKRGFLTMEEIRLIEKVDLPASLEHIRNYFLLSCYTGLRFGDAKAFNKEKYIVNNNGVERIIISTEKMDEPVSLKLSDNVKGIVEKLNKPLPCNVHTNRLLKLIGVLAKIKKPLNFHLSRHSAAVNMAAAGLPMEAVAKILGHTNIRTTAIYYKITDTRIDDYMDKFDDFTKEKK